MNKNVKIAKQLIKIAKSLIASDNKISKYDIKHPFTFTKNGQGINEVKEAIKNGEPCNGIIMTGTAKIKTHFIRTDYFDSFFVDNGEMLCPVNLEDKKEEILKSISKSRQEKWGYDGHFNFKNGRWSYSSTYDTNPEVTDQIELDNEKINVFWDMKYIKEKSE